MEDLSAKISKIVDEEVKKRIEKHEAKNNSELISDKLFDYLTSLIRKDNKSFSYSEKYICDLVDMVLQNTKSERKRAFYLANYAIEWTNYENTKTCMAYFALKHLMTKYVVEFQETECNEMKLIEKQRIARSEKERSWKLSEIKTSIEKINTKIQEKMKGDPDTLQSRVQEILALGTELQEKKKELELLEKKHKENPIVPVFANLLAGK